MRRVGDVEDQRWLGGEAQVHPYNGRPKPASLKRLIPGSMLLLAGIGLGSLGAVGISNRAEREQRVKVSKDRVQTSRERGAIMEQGRMDERPVRDGGVDEMGIVTILAAFGLGLLAGAVATLLTTPESGASVRTRLKSGMETAKRELDEVVGEAKEDWNTVGGDVREAVKRTASRVKEAAAVTKEALKKNDTTRRS